MPTAIIGATALTGGAAGALDAVECEDILGDGTDRAIATGDFAVVVTSDKKLYLYRFNASGTDSEASPHIIVPDDRADCSGNGQWELVASGRAAEEIVQASTDTLTALECMGQVISNYGQAAANTQTLPSASQGLHGRVQIATAGAGAFHLKAGASDKIYLDGVALDDGDKASLASPAVGDWFSFWAFQTGAAAWDWMVASGVGALTDGGA